MHGARTPGGGFMTDQDGGERTLPNVTPLDGDQRLDAMWAEEWLALIT